MKLINWIGGLSVFGVLLLLAFPLVIRGPHRRPDKTEALSNVKQIGLCLFEFDTEYGTFPDATTITAVQAHSSTPLTLGSTSSNAFFRQILADGISKSERIFWARTTATPKKPDDIFTSDATVLAPGECAFSYIAGLSSSGDPDTPVVVCPLIPGTTRFDPKPFDGKAIILRLDSSARAETIDKSGRVIVNGMDLFDPRQPFWHGKVPDIKWPE